MLGDFITRSLVLILGYAYPAFECLKTVEKNRVDIEELRFWCQYWIIVSALTVFERIGDVFLSWLPMYGEMKLALIIYLWYPKTKGTGYVYETLLRPYFSRHETDFDRKIREFRARAWDFAIYYWQNCTELGQTKFFEVLQYLADQFAKFTTTKKKPADRYPPSAPPLPPDSPPSRHRSSKKQTQTPSTAVNHAAFQAPNVERLRVPPVGQTAFSHDPSMPDPSSPMDEAVQAVRLRLRRFIAH